MTAEWVAACMEPSEWAEWQRLNPRALNASMIATRPCRDCPAKYARMMAAVGRCNGTPGQVPVVVRPPRRRVPTRLAPPRKLPEKQKPVPVPQNVERPVRIAPGWVLPPYLPARAKLPDGDLWFCEPCEGWHDAHTSRRLTASLHSEVWRPA